MFSASMVAATLGTPRGCARKKPNFGLKGLLQGPTHTLKNKATVSSSTSYDSKESDVWASLKYGVQTVVTVETVKYIVDEARSLFRRFQHEQRQMDMYWYEASGSLSSLMLATGLSIGICFDWVTKEIVSNSRHAGSLAPVIVLVIFVLLHGAAAWEASNIYASAIKRRWESIQMFNQLPKGCLLVGIAITPLICLGCFLLGRLVLAALPVLREVTSFLRDIAGVFLGIFEDSLRALSALAMAFFSWVKDLASRGSAG